MITAMIAAIALSGMALQEQPATEDQAPAAAAPAASTRVQTITSRGAPTGETRTVCGWERATGSTMNRRVCREVAVHQGQRERESSDMLRNMQGSRFGELPIAKEFGGRNIGRVQ